MDVILQDVRYALRGLRQNPGFTAVAILTLALGIGATTAAYSVIAASLTARIPVRDLDRVVGVWSFDRTMAGRGSWSRWLISSRGRHGNGRSKGSPPNASKVST